MFLTVLLTEIIYDAQTLVMGKVDCLIHYSRTINIACLVMEEKKTPNNTINDMDYINGLFRCVLAT